jgi:hypothetical protein
LDGKKCVAYSGKCDNGDLIAQKDRTQENHCVSCNDGYYLNNKKCNKIVCESGEYLKNKKDKKCTWFDCNTTSQGEGCASCVLQSERTSNTDCSSCHPGYYLDGKKCKSL